MQLPANIGKYELQEFLGGGMARVYKARDTIIGRTVAVKILTDEGCADEQIKSRFLQEAQLAGNISHDNIISIYDFGEDNEGRPFMVMEFLKGQDLRHAIEDGSVGDIRNRLRIALELARALEHIHSVSIIHRDIKPDNVHITSTGSVKLMDFGISKKQDSTRTTTGIIMGTPYYMAPEQVLGKGMTGQVDVYAFGVLLFELMTGQKPVTGETVERIFYCILQEPLNLEPLRERSVPEPIVELICSCTEKDPALRPQGFGDVGARIQKISEGWDAATRVMKPGAAPVPETPSTRKAWVLPAVIAAMVVVLVVVYFAVRPARRAELPKVLATSTGEMVLVPAGPFLFGEKKESTVLPAFYIDKTQVTIGLYAKFCAEKGRPLPSGMTTDYPNYPVTDITIVDAREFAKWAGKRLPTSPEWEKAARGTDGRLYPWGNEATRQPAEIVAVTAFPTSASPYGALNTVGLVFEFVDESRNPSPAAINYFAKRMQPPPSPQETWYVIRGGAYNVPLSNRALYDSTTVPARHHTKNIGFRCARNP